MQIILRAKLFFFFLNITLREDSYMIQDPFIVPYHLIVKLLILEVCNQEIKSKAKEKKFNLHLRISAVANGCAC